MALQTEIYIGQRPVPEHDRYPWLVCALLLAKVLLARFFMLGHAFGPGVLLDALAVVAMVALAAASSSRHGRKVVFFLAVGLSFIFFASVVYARYYEQLPSLRLFAMSRQAGTVGESVRELLRLADLLFWIDLPVLGYHAFRPAAVDGTWRKWVAAGGLTGMIVMVAVASAMGSAPIMDSRGAGYSRGFIAYELSTLAPERASAQPNKSDETQRRIDRLVGRDYSGRQQGAPAHGAYKGYNVIVVQCEALQNALIGTRIDGKPLMPNLERFAGQRYFPNTYSQIGKGNTSDAEFIANTSLLPALDQASSVAYASKELPGLPRMLGAQGYKTMTFHANDVKYWNRFQLYPALGFQRYYDERFFGTEGKLGFGVRDGVMFDKTLTELEKLNESGTPFYAHIITVTAHHPFRWGSLHSQLELPQEYRETYTGRFLRSQNYADDQLATLFERLERDGLLENTIVVMYGDHFGLRELEPEEKDVELQAALFGDRAYNPSDFLNIPMIIHVPGQTQGRRVPTVLGQVDVMPTVADLLGLDLAGTPHFGRSAFERTPTMLTNGGYLATGLYIDDQTLYLPGITAGDGRLYSPVTHARLSGTTAPAKAGNALGLLELSSAYARGLPERSNVTTDVGFIPNANGNGSKMPSSDE